MCDVDDCNGCSCHITAPCTHCVEDHDNVDNYPVCENCGAVVYTETEIEYTKHKVNCFELI